MRFEAFVLFMLYCNNFGTSDIVDCLTEDGATGQCTLISLCEDKSQFDERSFGECLNDEVCCSMPENTTTTKSTTTRTEPENTTQRVTTTAPTISTCGVRNVQSLDADLRSMASEDSSFAETSWTALVYKKGTAESKYTFLSGGSLIHPKVVMTTIHKIKKLKGNYKLRVRLGEYDLGNTDEILPYQEKDVSQTIMHESYRQKIHVNNIGLLILESPVTLAENVGTICLPPSGFIPTSVNECFFTGWGAKEFITGEQMSSVMKIVDVPIIERKNCQEKLRKTRLGPTFNLSETSLCAGGKEGYDACTNDGGSPLVCQIPDKQDVYMQVGMVSWGIGCNSDVPGVYVNIPYLRDWIDDTLIIYNINIVE